MINLEKSTGIIAFTSQNDPSWDAIFDIEKSGIFLAIDYCQQHLIKMLQNNVYIPSDLECDFLGLYIIKGDKMWRPYLRTLGIEQY